MSRYLRPRAVSEEYGIDESTLATWRWQTAHGLPRGPESFRLHGVVLYDSADVEAWIAEQRAKSQGGAA